MATQQATIDELLERFEGIGPLTARKMFGEYCIYLKDKPVALVCDNKLYVKQTDAGRDLLSDPVEAPPYPKAKAHFVFLPEQWIDSELLGQLLQVTYQKLPKPKPRKKGKR